MPNWTKASVLLVPLLATACSTTKDAVIPQEGPTMVEIYRKHMAGLERDSPRLVRERLPLRPPVEAEPAAFTRTALNETNQRFPRVANPDLVMFVFPHLAGKERNPVPGYTTAFSMYDSVNYALPGEVSPREAIYSSPPAKTVPRDAAGRALAQDKATQSPSSKARGSSAPFDDSATLAAKP